MINFLTSTGRLIPVILLTLLMSFVSQTSNAQTLEMVNQTGQFSQSIKGIKKKTLEKTSILILKGSANNYDIRNIIYVFKNLRRLDLSNCDINYLDLSVLPRYIEEERNRTVIHEEISVELPPKIDSLRVYDFNCIEKPVRLKYLEITSTTTNITEKKVRYNGNPVVYTEVWPSITKYFMSTDRLVQNNGDGKGTIKKEAKFSGFIKTECLVVNSQQICSKWIGRVFPNIIYCKNSDFVCLNFYEPSISEELYSKVTHIAPGAFYKFKGDAINLPKSLRVISDCMIGGGDRYYNIPIKVIFNNTNGVPSVNNCYFKHESSYIDHFPIIAFFAPPGEFYQYSRVFSNGAFVFDGALKNCTMKQLTADIETKLGKSLDEYFGLGAGKLPPFYMPMR